MADRLVMLEQPQLIAPYIMIGLNGWLNASEISTGSIDYLRRQLGARKFAHIESQGYYIYQIPSVSPELRYRQLPLPPAPSSHPQNPGWSVAPQPSW